VQREHRELRIHGSWVVEELLRPRLYEEESLTRLIPLEGRRKSLRRSNRDRTTGKRERREGERRGDSSKIGDLERRAKTLLYPEEKRPDPLLWAKEEESCRRGTHEGYHKNHNCQARRMKSLPPVFGKRVSAVISHIRSINLATEGVN